MAGQALELLGGLCDSWQDTARRDWRFWVHDRQSWIRAC